MAKFKAALDNHTHKAAIDGQRRSATRPASAARRRSSINGYFVSGAQPFPKFKKLIELALKEAK